MTVADSMGWGPWQLEHTDTAIKVRASTAFSLSVQVSELGPALLSSLPLGSGQRSGLSCKDIVLQSVSVVGAVLKEGQL